MEEKTMSALIEETQRVLLSAAVKLAGAAGEGPTSDHYGAAGAQAYATAAKTLVDAAHAAASRGMFHK